MQSPSNPFLSVSCDKCKSPINAETRFEYLCGHIICRVCDTGRTCHYCGHPGPANQLPSNEKHVGSDICEACEDTALYYCVTCPKLLCDRCAHIHSVNPTRRDHQVVFLRDYPRQVPHHDGGYHGNASIPDNVFPARRRDAGDQWKYDLQRGPNTRPSGDWEGEFNRKPSRKTLGKQFSYSKSVSSRASSVHSMNESMGKASVQSSKSEKSVGTDVSGQPSMIKNNQFTIMVYNHSESNSTSSGNLKQIQITRSRERFSDSSQRIIPEEKETFENESSKMSEKGTDPLECRGGCLHSRGSNVSLTSNTSYSSHCCGSHLDEVSRSRSRSCKAPQSELSKSDTMDNISDIFNDRRPSVSSENFVRKSPPAGHSSPVLKGKKKRFSYQQKPPKTPTRDADYESLGRRSPSSPTSSLQRGLLAAEELDFEVAERLLSCEDETVQFPTSYGESMKRESSEKASVNSMKPDKVSTPVTDQNHHSPLIEKVRDYQGSGSTGKVEFIDEGLFENRAGDLPDDDDYLTHSSTYSDQDLSNIAEEPTINTVSSAPENDGTEEQVILFDDGEEMVVDIKTSVECKQQLYSVLAYEGILKDCSHHSDPISNVRESARSEYMASRKRERSLSCSESIPNSSAVSKESFITASSCNELNCGATKYHSASSESINSSTDTAKDSRKKEHESRLNDSSYQSLDGVSDSSVSISNEEEYCKKLHPLLTFSDYDEDEPDDPTSSKRIMLDRILSTSYLVKGENLGFMENLPEPDQGSLTGVSSLPPDRMYCQSQEYAGSGGSGAYSDISMKEVQPLSITTITDKPRRCKNVVIGEEPEEDQKEAHTLYFDNIAEYVEWSKLSYTSFSETSSVVTPDFVDPCELEENMVDQELLIPDKEDHLPNVSEQPSVDIDDVQPSLEEESIAADVMEGSTMSVNSVDASSVGSTIVDEEEFNINANSPIVPENMSSTNEGLIDKLPESDARDDSRSNESLQGLQLRSFPEDLDFFVDAFNDAMEADMSPDAYDYGDGILFNKPRKAETILTDAPEAKVWSERHAQTDDSLILSESSDTERSASEKKSKLINNRTQTDTSYNDSSVQVAKSPRVESRELIEDEPFKRKYSKRVSALRNSLCKSATLPRNRHDSNKISEMNSRQTQTLPRKQSNDKGGLANFITQTYKDRGPSPKSYDESRLLSRSLTFGSVSDYKKFSAEEHQWERSLPRHLGRKVYMRNPSLKQVDWSVMGRKGTEPGYLMNPTGIAVDEGCVAIAEEGNGRIQIFIEDESEYCINNLINPCGIALSSDHIYVSDIDINVIQIYGRNALQVAELGGPGSMRGQFNEPRGIAINPSNSDLAVCDTENHRVQIFDGMGNYIKTLGRKGKARGEFREPISCCYDNWGRLLVSDHCNYRVQLFDNNYQYISEFGKYGKSSGEFWGVNGICSHRNGDILVVDSDNNCLSVHSSDGRFISVFGRRGAERWEFLYPHSVASDEAGNVYVSDWGNHRIHIMDKKLLPYLELESHML